MLDGKVRVVQADGIGPQFLSTRQLRTVVASTACRLGQHAVEGADKDKSLFSAMKANAMPETDLDVEGCQERMEARRPHCVLQQRCMAEMYGHMSCIEMNQMHHGHSSGPRQSDKSREP